MQKQREKKISHELLRQATHFVIVKSDTNGHSLTHTHQNARYLNNNLFGFSFHLFSGPFLRFVAVEPAACIRMLPYKLLMPTRRRKTNGISKFARARAFAYGIDKIGPIDF